MKHLKYVLFMMISFLFTFVGMNIHYTGNPLGNYDQQPYQIYLNAVENGFEGDYKDWLNYISSEDSSPIELRIENNWIEWKYIDEEEESWRPLLNVLSFVGLNELDFKDQHTPHIGENGTWWIGEEDTGIIAFDTSEQNGLTPFIGENGNWWIGTTDTGVLAGGLSENNEQGGVGIVSIEYLGNLNGVDTYLITFSDNSTYTYELRSGTNGEDGLAPHIGDNGHWWIGTTDTGIRAEATNGTNGLSAFEIFLKYYPDYEGDEQQWIEDLLQGNLIVKTFHTVTFDSAGGSFIPNQIVEDGKKVIAPSIPTREGYDFVDWMYGEERWVFIGYIVTEDMTLTASWNQTYFPPAPEIYEDLPTAQTINSFWSIPSVGSPKVLVVPVEFPDVLFENPSMVQNNINQVFNGESTDTFQSLKSFYQTSSFGKLQLTGEVTQPFKTTYTSSYYENLANNQGNTAIINEIMTYFDNQYDFNDFDYDGDGNLDGIYMIYSKNYGAWGSFWWAYLWSYFGSSTFDTISPTAFIWMPYNMVLVNNELQSRVFIHETGHMLGLEDYYDYDEDDGSGNEGGLGYADMMHGNVGDHNPWSKMILGWLDAWVVNESMTVKLDPYISSGQALIITEDWNGTLFDEFIVAMYFTNEGLYQDIDIYFDSQPGLVLYHVDARLGPSANPNSVYPNEVFINNNTDTPNKLIKFIEADGNNSLLSTGFVWAADVYRPGDIFNQNRNMGYRWHQLSLGTVGFTISFEEESDGMITLNIQFPN